MNIVASARGHIEIVKELLNKGSSITAKNIFGLTALMLGK